MNTRDTIYYQLIDIMNKLNLSPSSEIYASNDASNFQHLIPEHYKEKVLQLEKKKITQGHSEFFSMKMGYGVSLGGTFGRNGIAQTAKQIKQRKFGECHTYSQLVANEILTAIEEGAIKPFQIIILSHKAGLGSHTFVVANSKIINELNSENINDLNTFTDSWIVDGWACVMGQDDRQGIFTIETYPYDTLKNLICVYDSNKDPVHQERIGNKQLAENLLAEREKEKEALSKTKSVKSSIATESVQPKVDEVESFIKQLASLIKKQNQRLRDLNKYRALYNLLKLYQNKELSPEVILSQAINAYFSDPASFKEEGTSYNWNKASGVPKMGSEQLDSIIKTIKLHQKVSSILKLDADEITPTTIINLCKKSSAAQKEMSPAEKPVVSITQVSILAQPNVSAENQQDKKIKEQFLEIQKSIESYRKLVTLNESEQAIQHFLSSPKLSEVEKEFYGRYKDSFLNGHLTASNEDNDKVIQSLCKKMKDNSDEYQKRIHKILIQFQNHLSQYKEHNLKRTKIQENIKALMKELPISETNIKDYSKRYISLDEGKELDHKAELNKLLTEYHSTAQYKLKV